MSHLGEIAAVATSVSWTLCALGFAFAGRRIGALAVNQIRIVAAVVVLIAAHALLYGTLFPSDASAQQLGYLALSGIAGLTLGDLFYFHSMTVLGPRLGALLMGTHPLFSVLIAWPVLGEQLGPQAIVGIALTVGGVAVVLADRSDARAWDPGVERGSRRVAIIAGLLGALGQAGGMVLAKLGMDPEGAQVTPLSATLVRMIAGMLGILLVGIGQRHIGPTLRALRDGRAMSATMIGTLFGPVMGVWLSMVALTYTETGIAAALMALPPVLMIPVARVAYGSRVGVVAILGTILAVAGTAVLFLRTTGTGS